MSRGRRRRLAKNLYKDDAGLAYVVRVAGQTAELRFPHGTPLHEIQRDVAAKRLQLLEQAGTPELRGTLGHLIAAYLRRQSGERRKDRARLLKPWRLALGKKRLSAIARRDLQRVADTWRADGLSAARVNKRISALSVCWKAMRPDTAPTHGIERLTRYSEPHATIRSVPMPLVQKIIDAAWTHRSDHEESKSIARLRLLAWTGQPPARIKLITPAHVDWAAEPPMLYVMPRRKGKGSADAWLPLIPQAQEALKEFFRVDATGDFPVRVLARSFQRAVKTARLRLRLAGRPQDTQRLVGMRLYDLRHSFLTALGESAPDIYAVAEYAGHASLQTTRRYMRGAARERMKQSIAALAAAVPRPRATVHPFTRRRKRRRRPTKAA